jgi:hypothetical protein
MAAMPTVAVTDVVNNASNTADITAGGAYFNQSLLGIAFVVTVTILVITVAYQWIVRRATRGAVRAIGVKSGGGRRRRR